MADGPILTYNDVSDIGTLCAALEDLADLAKTYGARPSTVYTRLASVSLEQVTLSDGSTVFNLILTPEA